jgi:hypothetical protein
MNTKAMQLNHQLIIGVKVDMYIVFYLELYNETKVVEIKKFYSDGHFSNCCKMRVTREDLPDGSKHTGPD